MAEEAVLETVNCVSSNLTEGIMKKLTRKQIVARIEMYEEAIEHLDMDVCDTKEEIRQAKIVQNQIRKISLAFQKRYLPA